MAGLWSRRQMRTPGGAATSPRRCLRLLVPAVCLALVLSLTHVLYTGKIHRVLPLRRVHVEPLNASYMDTFRLEGDVSSIPDVAILRSLPRRHLERLYYSYLDNIDFLCRRKLRLGYVGDGGWEVCDDEEYRPTAPCIVYSFGINGDYSFDDAAARVYGCNVYSFDPTMYVVSHNRSKLVHFFELGIGYEDGTNEEGWEVRTLGSLMAMLGHQGKTLDVLKMDVEVAEWKAIPEMAYSGSLRSIRQLFVEFHYLTKFGDQELLGKLAAIRAIEDAGFKRFYSHKNPVCDTSSEAIPGAITMCYEVYFLNPRLAKPTRRPNLARRKSP